MKATKILGILLLLGGAALVIFGIYQFVEFRQSLAGKLSSFGNQLSRSLGGSSKIADGYLKPIALLVSGVVAGAAGLFLFKKS